jgi:hypothetical protein
MTFRFPAACRACSTRLPIRFGPAPTGVAFAFAFALALVAAPAGPAAAEPKGASREAACSFSDMRACDSCNELADAVKDIEPHDGRYEENIKWSPLFGAFLKNCQRLALHLVEERGADPALGGRYGSMLVTVSTHWDLRNPRTSAQWARILKRLGADADTVLPDTGKSSRQLVEEGVVKIDYPQIWSGLADD